MFDPLLIQQGQEGGAECPRQGTADHPLCGDAQHALWRAAQSLPDQPCLTRNAYGAGKAYYLAAKVEGAGLQAIYATLAEELQLTAALPDALPYGVVATQRGNTVFMQNFSGDSRKIVLSGVYTDLLTGANCAGAVEMPVNGVMVLEKKR